MSIYIKEKHVIFIHDINTKTILTYCLEKDNMNVITLKQIIENEEHIINLYNDIYNREIYNILRQLYMLFKNQHCGLAEQYILNHFKNENLVDIEKYMDIEEIKNFKKDNYEVRVVRYFFKATGKLHERVFKKKWTDKNNIKK